MRLMCQEGNSTLIPPGKSPGNMDITKMHSVFKNTPKRDVVFNQDHTSTMATLQNCPQDLHLPV